MNCAANETQGEIQARRLTHVRIIFASAIAITAVSFAGALVLLRERLQLSRRVFTGYRTPSQFPKLTYAESRADLTSYAAQDTDKVVQLRFRFGTDFCNGTDIGWYLDDVEVYECRARAG